MIFISKTCQPDSFSDWKKLECEDWKPTWESLQNPEKSELLTRLIADQKGICCYCECRISSENSHIEHIVPRSCSEDLRLQFNNLIASCLKESEKGQPLTCGKARGNWNDVAYLDPCHPSSETHIVYLMDGKVAAKHAQHAPFVDKLNLNTSLKMSSRLAAAAVIVEDDELSEQDVRDYLTRCLAQNQHQEYISFLISAANEYFGVSL